MLVLPGRNIWDLHSEGYSICIATNGVVNSSGRNVMGKGIAKEAADRFPWLSLAQGENIKRFGNRVFYYSNVHLFSFPTKQHWRDKSELSRIAQSATQLRDMNLTQQFIFHMNSADTLPAKEGPIFLPQVGCGNGGLDRAVVIPTLYNILDSTYIMVI